MSRISAKRVIRLAFPFFASVFATVSIVVLAKSLMGEKKAATMALIESPVISDLGPRGEGHTIIGLGGPSAMPEWIGKLISGIAGGVAGTPAQADYTGRPVIGRKATFEVLFDAKPLALTKVQDRTDVTTAPTPDETPSIAPQKGAPKAAAKPPKTKGAVSAQARENPRPAPVRAAAQPIEPPSSLSTLAQTGGGPTVAIRLAPMEEALVSAIRKAETDFRYADHAAERTRQFLAANPNAPARASYESRISDIFATRGAALRERSSFDLFTEAFASPNIGGPAETQLTDCLKPIAGVATATVARKTVAYNSSVPAYFALIEAPEADKRRGELKQAITRCLEPLSGTGTVSLLLNTNGPETRALLSAMAGVPSPIIMLGTSQRAEADQLRQNRQIQ